MATAICFVVACRSPNTLKADRARTATKNFQGGTALHAATLARLDLASQRESLTPLKAPAPKEQPPRKLSGTQDRCDPLHSEELPWTCHPAHRRSKPLAHRAGGESLRSQTEGVVICTWCVDGRLLCLRLIFESVLYETHSHHRRRHHRRYQCLHPGPGRLPRHPD